MNNKPDLILDIDETLVKSYFFSVSEKSQIPLMYYQDDKLFLTNYNDDNHSIIIYKRPYLFEFLTEMKKYFNISIYSLGHTNYINIIINRINEIYGENIFKDICANDKHNYKYFKYLHKINVNYDNCIIIDDRTDVWHINYNKLFNILPYNIPNEEDDELLKIMNKVNFYFKNLPLDENFNYIQLLKLLKN